MITRIAPTPSGYLHKGNLFNFMLNWLWARANGGKVMLRIDDADSERKRKEYVEDIFFVLQQFDLDWDLGPGGPDDFEENWSQFHRKNIYSEMLQQLVSTGKVYACRCSRTTFCDNQNKCNCHLHSHSLETNNAYWKIHVKSGEVISINKGISFTLNQDFVIRKKDGQAAYPITSLSDDRHFGITHIARGEDLLESTARQLYIDSLLSNPQFHQVVFIHHPLLLNDSNEKLSKSAGFQSMSILENETKESILMDFSIWMKWDTTQFRTLNEMLTHPSLKCGLKK